MQARKTQNKSWSLISLAELPVPVTMTAMGEPCTWDETHAHEQIKSQWSGASEEDLDSKTPMRKTKDKTNGVTT